MEPNSESPMIEVSRTGVVHRIQMQKKGNTLEPTFLRALHAAIDRVEADCEGPAALVLIGNDRFFSNGLDLELLRQLPEEEQDQVGGLITTLLGRLLMLPIPVIAAVNGHAFAGGAFLAMAADFRVMREDRGWFCVSEVDVGVPIGYSMMSLLAAKLSPQVLRSAVLTGRRYTGREAMASGIVEVLASEAELLQRATTIAAALAAKERGDFGSVKRTMNGRVARLLGVEATPVGDR